MELVIAMGLIAVLAAVMLNGRIKHRGHDQQR